MTYKKITAVVRCTELADVEHALQEAGVKGLMMTHVRGYGEYANFFRDDWTVKHARVEIFLDSDEVARIVSVLKGAARSGIVAVLPVEQFHHIREAEPEESAATPATEA